MRAALLLVILTGCRQLLGFESVAAGDAPRSQTCTSNSDCTQDVAPICKLPAEICVQCVEDTACTGTTPVCDQAANSCQACTAHANCLSEVCLPTGACADVDDVAYIAPNGTGGDCARATPCADLLVAIATTKSLFKVTGTLTVDAPQDLSRDVTVFAEPGAALTRTDAGSIVQVANGVDVTIYDLEIFGAENDGITMTGVNTKLTLERVLLRGNRDHGISAVTGGADPTLTIRRSIIVQNDGGGIEAMDVKLDMANNLIVRNGSPATTSGGLELDPLPGSKFEFNTVAANASLSAASSGVSCITSFSGLNNIVVDNALGAQCTFDFTLFDNTTTNPAGNNNVLGEARFASTDPADPRSTMFYRITANSSARDTASANATIDIDIDGQPRPSGSLRDIGADEFVP